ncbi:MAG: helix-turn-helix transcriptional regulator [Candidatus Aminicenantes bacterium]|nr:helix-turn-helix transcriptional regulator [Candidatus Aminicenantes bacterium]
MAALPTVNESMFLASIIALGDDAYGVAIREKAAELSGTKVTYGCLYSHLDQIHRKGYVVKRLGDPTAERGGRGKIFYTATPAGLKALKSFLAVQKSIRAALPAVVLEGKS